jgi:hypothetical protein
MIDEEAHARVDREFFHQSGAGAHRHRPDHLTARRLRIQDAARRAHGKHAPDAGFAGCGVNADFDKMRTKG